jgi:hypothetical protein
MQYTLTSAQHIERDLCWYNVKTFPTLGKAAEHNNEHCERIPALGHIVNNPRGQFPDYIYLFVERNCNVPCSVENTVPRDIRGTAVNVFTLPT